VYSYNELDGDLLTKDELLNDENFIKDASAYLEARNKDIYAEPEEVYDAFMSQMRESSVNEVETYRDWMYVSELGDDAIEEKTRAAKLFHTFDKMDAFGGVSDDQSFVENALEVGSTLKDYAVGIVNAPSTYVGLVTGGTGKAAGVAAQQVAKFAVRKALMKSLTLQGMKRAAIVEGGIGAVQDFGNQKIRAEVDEDRDFSYGQLAASTAISGTLGGVISAPNSWYQSKNAIKVERIKNIGERAERAVINTAVDAAEETIKKAKYRPLDELKVELGEVVREGKLETLSPGEQVFVGLSDSTFARIQAAAIDVIGDVKPKVYKDGTKQRITEAVGDAISAGKFKAENLVSIMDKYKLTDDQFGMIYIADVSRAAKVLNTSSQIKRLRDIAGTIEQLTKENASLFNAVDPADFIDADKMLMTALNKSADALGAYERMRRAVLTSQIQTTQRNIIGGGTRVALDALDTFWEATSAGLQKSAGKALGKNITPVKDRSYKDVGAVLKYMLKPAEAQLIREAYNKRMPMEAQRLFSNYVDAGTVSAKTSVGRGFQRIGMWANWANRQADNTFKQAIFAGELSREVRGKTGEDVLDLFVQGRFGEIDQKSMLNATEKAYDLLYQAQPTDPLSRAWLKADNSALGSVILGTVIPYPRFVSNQIRFMAEYAPFVNFLTTKMYKPRDSSSSWQVKQASSASMLLMSYAYATTQPFDDWYNVTDDKTKAYGDMRPNMAGFQMWMYLGSLMNRIVQGQPNDFDEGNWGKIAKNVGEMMAGTSFKLSASTKWLDGALPDLFDSDKAMSTVSEKTIGAFIGDTLSFLSYNLPVGIARDLFKLTDEDERYIPQTNGEMSWSDIAVMRMTRGMPSFMRPESPDRYTVTSPEAGKTFSPLSAMGTGVNLQRPKNAFERELGRLNLTSYDFYKPVPFGPINVAMTEFLSKRLPLHMTKYIQNDKQYNSSRSDSAKQQLIKDEASSVVTAARNYVFDDLIKKTKDNGIDPVKIRKFEFESTSTKRIRKAFLPFYEDKFKKPLNLEKMTANEIKEATEFLKAYEKTFPKRKYAQGGLVKSSDNYMASMDETYVEPEDVTAGDEELPFTGGDIAMFAAEMAPVSGEILSAKSAVEDYKEGNYGMAALGAVGAIPGVGVLGKGAKAGIRALRTVDKAEDKAEALKLLDDDTAVDAWKSENRLPESQRQKRNPVVQQAAKDLSEGNITGKDYRATVKGEMPIKSITRENFPEMPTTKEIVGALTKDKAKKGVIGLNLDIADGTRVGSRLDIPAYDDYDTWIVSLHDGTKQGGKALGYGQSAVLNNVEFFTSGKGALNISKGDSSKKTIARIHGDYENRNPEEVYQQAFDLLDDPEWTQVGMNPFRHSFFYDKATGNPVTRADQVLQVGPLVLAKGARSGLGDLKKLKIKSSDGKVRVFNKGGLMSPSKY
jgi:hypothetical protein